MNPVEVKVFQCGVCKKYYLTKDAADSCCVTKPKPEKVCEDCGVPLDPKSYFCTCDGCREKRRYNRCRKMTIEEYEKEFPDNMVIVGDDNYYSSVDDALDSCYGDEMELPHYVYGTKKIYATVNVERAVESALEDAYEDAEFDNLDELYAFVDEWNEKNKLTMFEEAKIVIDIPEEVRKEYLFNQE